MLTTTLPHVSATYSRLASGAWGIRCTGDVSTITTGSSVRVTKRDGRAASETVARVLWTDGRALLAAIVPTAVPASRAWAAGPHRHQCPDCGDYVQRGSTCWETGLAH